MALVGSITYLRSYVYICPLFVCYNFIKRQGSYNSFAPVPVFVSALYLSLLGFYFPLRKPESYQSVEPKNIIIMLFSNISSWEENKIRFWS